MDGQELHWEGTRMRMDWKPLEIARIGSCLEKGWGEQAASMQRDGKETVETVWGGLCWSEHAAWTGRKLWK